MLEVEEHGRPILRQRRLLSRDLLERLPYPREEGDLLVGEAGDDLDGRVEDDPLTRCAGCLRRLAGGFFAVLTALLADFVSAGLRLAGLFGLAAGIGLGRLVVGFCHSTGSSSDESLSEESLSDESLSDEESRSSTVDCVPFALSDEEDVV